MAVNLVAWGKRTPESVTEPTDLTGRSISAVSVEPLAVHHRRVALVRMNRPVDAIERDLVCNAVAQLSTALTEYPLGEPEISSRRFESPRAQVRR